jgi:Ca-activated chloride channel family protein
MLQRTYYDILEVSPTATPDEIKQSYRRLAKKLHPDTSDEEQPTKLFQELQAAYETLNDPQTRALYDAQLERERLSATRSARTLLSLRVMASHPRMQVLSEPQALYVWVEIKATPPTNAFRPRLNLCLVLDRSLSMEGVRLQQAREAASYLVDHLEQADTLSVVAFSDRAQVVVSGVAPSEDLRAMDPLVTKEAIRNIRPSGGTELLQGIQSGLEELRRLRTRDSLDHLILLTDGHTYGDEEGCLQAADSAGQERITMTLLGLGHDWNEQLLDEMAARSGGYATYVDSPSKLVAIFQKHFTQLSQAVMRDLQLSFKLNVASEIKEIYRVTPDITRLKAQNNVVTLGMLETKHPVSVLLEVSVKPTAVGATRVLRMQATGERLNGNLQHDATEAEVLVEFTERAEQVKPPEELIDLMGRIAAFKVQEKAMAEVSKGEYTRATSRLKNLATQLLNYGEVELSRALLLEAGEIARTGRLSEEGRKRIHYGTRSLSQSAMLTGSRGTQ